MSDREVEVVKGAVRDRQRRSGLLVSACYVCSECAEAAIAALDAARSPQAEDHEHSWSRLNGRRWCTGCGADGGPWPQAEDHKAGIEAALRARSFSVEHVTGDKRRVVFVDTALDVLSRCPSPEHCPDCEGARTIGPYNDRCGRCGGTGVVAPSPERDTETAEIVAFLRGLQDVVDESERDTERADADAWTIAELQRQLDSRERDTERLVEAMNEAMAQMDTGYYQTAYDALREALAEFSAGAPPPERDTVSRAAVAKWLRDAPAVTEAAFLAEFSAGDTNEGG